MNTQLQLIEMFSNYVPYALGTLVFGLVFFIAQALYYRNTAFRLAFAAVCLWADSLALAYLIFGMIPGIEGDAKFVFVFLGGTTLTGLALAMIVFPYEK